LSKQPLLTVALDESDREIAAAHRTVLAGLPDRWRITQAAADAAVVFGGHADWPSRAEAALASGVRGVLVTHPVWTNPAVAAALAAEASRAGVWIGVESAYLADPSWKRLVPTLREHAADAVLVDSFRTIPRSRSAVRDRQRLGTYCLEQLAVLKIFVEPLSAVAFSQQAPDLYVLGAESAGRALNVVGVRGGTASDQLTLDLVGLTRRWRVSFDSSAVARPTTIERMDASGTHASPAIYQTGRHGSWLELHEAITRGVPLSYDLALLVECLLLGDQPRVAGTSASEVAPTSASGLVA
jgi:hypothetical protein